MEDVKTFFRLLVIVAIASILMGEVEMTNFKFGDLNTVHHKCSCIKYYWRVLKFGDFLKSR